MIGANEPKLFTKGAAPTEEQIAYLNVGLKPDAIVLVATIRALKYNGGVAKADLSNENLDALRKGISNLEGNAQAACFDRA